MANKHHTHHVAQHAHHEEAYVQAFIKRLAPVALGVKARWGVPVSVLIAQGALESAWGQHVKNNAYFGIKGKSPAGDSVNFSTHEVVDGKSIAINDSFRAYTNLEEAADDYGQFLKNNPRYAVCFAFADKPASFVESLAHAGYATDPDYARKLKSIIHSHRLDAYDLPGEQP